MLHLDLDAFFAAVEQRDKPSLRGKPVIIGGTGPRGVVSTASYEAREFGVRSAMSGAEARRRCPNGAFLSGRFGAYRAASQQVMAVLRSLGTVEQLSIDEAYLDLAELGLGLAPVDPHDELSRYRAYREVGERLRADVAEATGGLTASVGIGTSKLMAKIGSELAKPDGLKLIVPGTEVATLAALPARAIPGIGPSTMERLERLGVRTVRDIQLLEERELIRALGKSWGQSLHELVFGRDDRVIEPSRETKSISTERTYAVDEFSRANLEAHILRDAQELTQRCAKARLFARTVTLKVRWPDFTTFTRSRTLLGSTDSAEVFAAVAIELLTPLDLRSGVRLLGLGVSNFTQAAQEPLFWDISGRDQNALLELVR
ncbi:MAG: DNA polymerase IV, partial [Propionibacteriaceae bacterium]